MAGAEVRPPSVERSGRVHKTFMRGHLTILHRERTRGLLSMVGSHCRLPFPTLRFLMFKNSSTFCTISFIPYEALAPLLRLFAPPSSTWEISLPSLTL